MKPEIGAVEEFKKTRPDVLARIQAKSLDAQERIIDTLDDGLVGALKPGQKAGLLIALNTINGTAFDKERLSGARARPTIPSWPRCSALHCLTSINLYAVDRGRRVLLLAR